MASFTNKKRLRYVITLSTGKFGSTDSNKVVIDGFRSTCDISLAGELMMGGAVIKIFGVSQMIMDSVTFLAWQNNHPTPNEIQVYAIDGTEESLAFTGNIINAWGDYQSIPDVGLHIQARSALTLSLKSVPPRSYRAGVDVASIFSLISKSEGYTFENNGVKENLRDQYLCGNPLDMMRELAVAANIDWGIDNNIVWIAPKGKGRNGLIPLISRETGMVGYPTFDAISVNVKMIYNPAIRQGGKVQVETDINRAKGIWTVQSFGHVLSSEMPGGPWFTNLRANYGEPIIPQ